MTHSYRWQQFRMSIPDYFSILDCSFDAGILVNDMGLILYANDQARQIFGIEDDVPNKKEHYLDGFVSLTSTPILVDDVVFTKWQDLLAIQSNACTLEEPSKTIEFLAACNDSAMLTEFLGHVRLTFLSNRILMAYIRMTDDCENLPSPMDVKIHETEEDDVYYDEGDEFQKEDVETMSGSEDPCQIDYTMNSVMDVSPDPIFYIQSSGIIIKTNDSASKLFGFSTNEFIGSNISLLFGDMVNNTTHDNFYIQNYIHTNSTEEAMRKTTLTARRKDGTEFPTEFVMAEIDSFDESEKVFCVFIRDQTEFKAREMELIHQKQRIHGIIECSLDPVFQMNSSGIIEIVNQAAVTLFGYDTKDDMLGKKLSMLLSKEQANIHNQKFCQYLETEKNDGIVEKRRELLARRKDDSEFLVQFTVIEIRTDIGNERFFAGFFHDLTETKKILAHEVEKVMLEALAIITPLTMLVET